MNIFKKLYFSIFRCEHKERSPYSPTLYLIDRHGKEAVRVFCKNCETWAYKDKQEPKKDCTDDLSDTSY